MTSDLRLHRPHRAAASETSIRCAPRPMDLAGKVVGLLDNTKEQADIILETVGEDLRERYGVARGDHPAQGVLLEARERRRCSNEMAKEVQVAIAAARRVRVLHVVQCARHGGIRETRHTRDGVPHAESSGTRRCITFRSKGMDGHPFIELPHPISNLTPDEMRARDAAFRRPDGAAAHCLTFCLAPTRCAARPVAVNRARCQRLSGAQPRSVSFVASPIDKSASAASQHSHSFSALIGVCNAMNKQLALANSLMMLQSNYRKRSNAMPLHDVPEEHRVPGLLKQVRLTETERRVAEHYLDAGRARGGCHSRTPLQRFQLQCEQWNGRSGPWRDPVHQADPTAERRMVG